MEPPTQYDLMMERDGPELQITIERETVQPDRSFSSDAMDAALDQCKLWIGTRIMRRWAKTNEPPTVCRVTVHVEVQ